MPTESRISDPEDPLEGFSGLSLFPRTLASVPNALKLREPNDLHLVHDFLVSMPFKSPSKILGQAKAIVASGSGRPECKIPSHATEKDENEVVDEKVKENPQERRRGLGRKRARFSMKPNSSQPTVNLEPSLDIDKLKDPEEFFLAFEKLENAKRELQKQTSGVLMDLNQDNISMAARPRRPGILGRSVRYKHRYSNVTPSQETLKENIIGSLDDSVQQETTILDYASQETEVADAELQETELAGSVAKSEKRVNDLLNELLACSCEDLDGDGAVNLLQEHLQIKPIDVNKLYLPDLQDVRRIDLKASGANLSKPRAVLSDIKNMLKGIVSKSPKKRQVESSVPSQASPTPLKSPLSSLVSLKRRIFQSSPLSDPFSSLNFDQSTAENASPPESIAKQTGQDNMEKELAISPTLKSSMIAENDIADVNMNLPQMATKDVTCSSDGTVNNNLGRLGPGVDVDIVDANMNLPEMATKDVTHSSDETVNNNLGRLGPGVDVGSNEVHADVEGTIGDSCVDNGVVNKILGRPGTDTDIHTNEPNEWNDTAIYSSDKTEKDSLSRLRSGVVNEILGRPGTDTDIHTNEPNEWNDMAIHSSDRTKKDSLSRLGSGVVNEILGRPGIDTDIHTNEPNEWNDKAIHSSNKTEKDGLSRLGSGVDVGSGKSHDDAASEIGDCCMDNVDVNETLGRPDADTALQMNELDKLSDEVEDMQHEVVDFVQPDCNMENSTVENLNSARSELDEASPPMVEDHSTHVRTETADTVPEQHNKEVQKSTGDPSNEQSKAISRPRKKRRIEAVTRRKSLAASGTSWESGTRRSTRIKSRPLEYWKGERFLYGRVHQSLATVIGIKYESPGSNEGKPGLKVKSFVSDQFKDLVDLAARY